MSRLKSIPASSMLCERHNHALSPLDDTIGRFSEAVGEFDHALGASVQTAVSESRSFSGGDIERWMLKCALGLSASGNLRKTPTLKPECIDLLFGRIDWPQGWGLYFSATEARTIYHSGSFLIETLVDPNRQLILAVNVTIRGLPFILCLDKPDNPERVGVWRPEAIIFRSINCEKSLSCLGTASPMVHQLY